MIRSLSILLAMMLPPGVTVVVVAAPLPGVTTAAVAAPLPGDPPAWNSNGLCSVSIPNAGPTGKLGWLIVPNVKCHDPSVTQFTVTGIISSERAGPDRHDESQGQTVLNPTPGVTYTFPMFGSWIRPGKVSAIVEVAIFQKVKECTVRSYVKATGDWGYQSSS